VTQETASIHATAGEPAPEGRTHQRWLSFVLHPWFGWLLLVLVVFPFHGLRASYETSLWVDELFSLRMATLPLQEMTDLTLVDAHPPGYYYLLSLWIGLGQWLGDPGGPLLWARLSSTLGMLLLVSVAWFGLRPSLGARTAVMVAWLLATSGMIAFQGHNLRNYAWVMAALMAGQVIWIHLHGPAGRRANSFGPWVLALLYGILGGIAVWFHLLAGLVLALQGVLWLGGLAVSRPSSWVNPRGLGLAAGQTLALILIVPVALQVSHQMGHVAAADLSWMGEISLLSLGSAWGYWLVWGIEWPGASPLGVMPLLVLGLGLVLTTAIQGWRHLGGRGRERMDLEDERSNHRWAFILGFSVTVGFVFLTWLVTMAGWAKIFFPPRYPVLVAPACFLWVAVACVSAGRPAGLFLIWILVGTLSQIAGHLRESDGGLPRAFERMAQRMAPDVSEPLYATDSALVPYLSRTFQGRPIRPIQDITRLPENRTSVTLLVTHPWRGIWSWPERVAMALSQSGHYSAPHRLEIVEGALSLVRAEQLQVAEWNRVTSSGLDLAVEASTHSLAVARPQDQWMHQGWHTAEICQGLIPCRMTAHPMVRWVWVDSAAPGQPRPKPQHSGPELPPGDYILHLVGTRPPFPEQEAKLTFRWEGHDTPFATAVAEPGQFHVQASLQLDRPRQLGDLRMETPTWRPADHGMGADKRRMGIQFWSAWVERQP
jgi:hypothetical protein